MSFHELLIATGNVAFTIVTLVLFSVALSTWIWMLHAWTTPKLYRSTALDTSWRRHEPCYTFSLLVPARHEESVLGATLDRLAKVDHPWVEIVVVVGDDDPGTWEEARAAALRWSGRIKVVVDASAHKSKPRALNTGLAACRGEIVGIFDAEDEVSVNVLRRVDAVLEHTGAQVVQGSVQLVTLRGSWFSLRNCLEYLFWYRSRLYAHARHGFVPLGGNTVFFRREAIDDAGGWDGACLAEDCEIGIRLSSSGAKVAIWFDPDTTTREETPATLKAFVRQRTRWDQGYIQVLRKRYWKALPTRRQRALAQYVLAFPLIQAAAGLLLPICVVLMVAGDLPLLLTLIAFAAVAVMLCVIATETVGLFELSRTFSLDVTFRDYVWLVATTIPYQVVLCFAGCRAAWRQLLGQGSWEKTMHRGRHRDAGPTPALTD